MKRAASPTTPTSEGPRQRRQDQVSCNLCRQRKVRCNRVQPCANCALRGLECVYPPSSREVPVAVAVAPSEASSTGSNVSETLREIQAQLAKLEESVAVTDVRDRLERIEKSLAASTGGVQANIYVNVDARGQTSPDEAAVWLEQLAMNTAQMMGPGQVKGFETPTTSLFAGLEYDDAGLFPDCIAGTGAYVRVMNTPLGPVNLQMPENGVVGLLPPREQAEQLVRIFRERIAWMHHVIHFPTMARQIDMIYTSLVPDLSQVALLFALMGVAMFYNSSDTNTKIKLAKSKIYAERYMTAAWLALEEVGWTSSPNIECLQAGVVLSHMLPNVGRFTQFFVLIGQMIRLAQAMGINQLDCPAAWEQRMLAPEEQDWVSIEIQRRIWWNVVSQEWFMSCMAGPGESLACIQPTKFAVAFPTNVDDCDISAAGDAAYARPLSEPTECAFLRQRIKLSLICQRISQLGPSMPYAQLLAIDRDFQTLYKEVPPFLNFNFSPPVLAILRERPYLAWQRNVAALVTNRMLCRLHRPYLIMGYSAPQWTYSRMVCLQTAMTILNIRRQIDGSGEFYGFPFTTVWVYMNAVLTAVVVLLMDCCHHPADPLWQPRRDAILAACRTLETARAESDVARRGIEGLYEFWKNWRRTTEGAEGEGEGGEGSEGLQSLGEALGRTAGRGGQGDAGGELLRGWIGDVMSSAEDYDQGFWDGVFERLDAGPGVDVS
ncbi:hypothetical protein EDC01DRAFT_754418 [Geopyxis carbonaria]|nr:hypothetical protein EDC01DRAFT_754418 [Geopyxis carbonaria]